jgi:hypothetical protein
MRNASIKDRKAWDETVDVRNTKRLKELLKDNGWPLISEYGEEAATAAWILVQHADHDVAFQEEILAKLQALPQGEVSLQHLSFLEDRTLVNRGLPQKYGSQIGPEYKPRPIADESNVDARRASMKMQPLAEYIEFVKKTCGD